MKDGSKILSPFVLQLNNYVFTTAEKSVQKKAFQFIAFNSLKSKLYCCRQHFWHCMAWCAHMCNVHSAKCACCLFSTKLQWSSAMQCQQVLSETPQIHFPVIQLQTFYEFTTHSLRRSICVTLVGYDVFQRMLKLDCPPAPKSSLK